jgi:hypothetical protein
MRFRFRERLRIGKGLYLNFGKCWPDIQRVTRAGEHPAAKVSFQRLTQTVYLLNLRCLNTIQYKNDWPENVPRTKTQALLS